MLEEILEVAGEKFAHDLARAAGTVRQVVRPDVGRGVYDP